MLICGSGSGIRDPLTTNSRGKLLVFRVVVAIFYFSKMIVDAGLGDCHSDHNQATLVVMGYEFFP